NESRFEVGKWKDDLQMGAIGINLEESIAPMILKSEHDPATIRRVRAHRCIYVTTPVVRYEAQVSAVRPDSNDIRRDSGFVSVSIFRENKTLAVRRPVLFDSN